MENQRHKFTIFIPITENSKGMKVRENNISAKPRTSQLKKIFSFQRVQKFDLSHSINLDKKLYDKKNKIHSPKKREAKRIKTKISGMNRKSKRWKKRIRSN